MEALKAFHLIGVAYFLGFLLLDAIVLRRFLDSECRGKKILFYEKAKYSLYFFTAVIVLTGVLMFYPARFYDDIFWLKGFFGIFSILLFFLSPILVKKFLKGYVGAIYAVVTITALFAGAIAVFSSR